MLIFAAMQEVEILVSHHAQEYVLIWEFQLILSENI
jgi:hypothetical protein